MGAFLVPVAIAGAIAAALFLLALIALLVRRSVLSRSVGAFDCSLRQSSDDSGWLLGVARYSDDRLNWFRLVDLSYRPDWSLPRARLTILDRRLPTQDEVDEVGDWVLVRCQYEATTLEFGMSEMAYNGLSAWLESAPPGEHPLFT